VRSLGLRLGLAVLSLIAANWLDMIAQDVDVGHRDPASQANGFGHMTCLRGGSGLASSSGSGSYRRSPNAQEDVHREAQSENFAKWPNIKAYMARIGARPKVQETMRAEGLLG